MSFFVMPNTDGGLGIVADAIERKPEFEERFQAIQELRNDSGTRDDIGRVSKRDGFVRVASFVGPVLDLAQVLDPDFMAGGKKNFYKFLDEHKSYCTYDRRKQQLSRNLTFVDGTVMP
jgi:hypothetical protein